MEDLHLQDVLVAWFQTLNMMTRPHK